MINTKKSWAERQKNSKRRINRNKKQCIGYTYTYVTKSNKFERKQEYVNGLWGDKDNEAKMQSQ